MYKQILFVALAACCCPSWGAVSFESAHAIVVDEATGEVLLEKNSDVVAPIASLTKLITAMVVLDARQDPGEFIRIDDVDMDTLKHTHSGVPVGVILPRHTLLELALMSSDNHAAAALARNYPGGLNAFSAATQQTIQELGLNHTALVEPTGLSPDNRASAADLVKVLKAASTYPEIAQITTKRKDIVQLNGRAQEFRNTNGLVGKPGWVILISKTGFTNEAGSCVAMRLQAQGRTVLVVLMGALMASKRALDALNIHRWLSRDQPPFAQQTTVVYRMRSAGAHNKAQDLARSATARRTNS
jgi:D-alanyl-D-alanine endopeptidase (penicillin-binding protein 7)